MNSQSSPHAKGEWRHFRRVSEDVTQERQIAVKVGGVGDTEKQQAGGEGGATTPSPAHALLARRAKLVEQAWLAVCREAVGAEGHVVPQQWLSHTSAPGVPTSDRRRLAPRASPFVAMPRWLAPSPERVPLTHERTILPASPCAWPRAASAQRIRNCSAAAASASSSLLWRSEGAGTPTRRRLSDSCRLQCLDA